MKEDNQIQAKSYSFAFRIVKLYLFLSEKKKEFVLSKQVLKSGTSIGALDQNFTGFKIHYRKTSLIYFERY